MGSLPTARWKNLTTGTEVSDLDEIFEILNERIEALEDRVERLEKEVGRKK